MTPPSTGIDDLAARYADLMLSHRWEDAREVASLISDATGPGTIAEQHAWLGMHLIATPGPASSIGDILMAQADAESNSNLLGQILNVPPDDIHWAAGAESRLFRSTGDQIRQAADLLVDFYGRVAAAGIEMAAEMRRNQKWWRSNRDVVEAIEAIVQVADSYVEAFSRDPDPVTGRFLTPDPE